MPRIKYYDTNSGTWKYADRVVNGGSGSGSNYNVQFVEQNLTDEQKNQVRNNIGAASEEEVSDIVEEVLGSGTGNLLRSTDIIDNLTTTSTDKPLSANQGKNLSESIEQVSQEVSSNSQEIEQVSQELQSLSNTITNLQPNFSYGTEDLEPGVSPLDTGKIYFVYE